MEIVFWAFVLVLLLIVFSLCRWYSLHKARRAACAAALRPRKVQQGEFQDACELALRQLGVE